MARVLEIANDLVWGAPALVLILGTGLYFSIRTRFAQLRLLPAALKRFAQSFASGNRDEGISPFQALCTALAATVGTGNLVGVAGAIALGGPGSIFWMWVCALLGMMTKFVEATLAVRFRYEQNGECRGGPMYIICHGLGPGMRFLARVYALLGVFAAFGVGNATQINALITGAHQAAACFGVEMSAREDLLLGAALAVLVGICLAGGAKRIAGTAELLVPLVSCAYLALCVWVLILRMDAVPAALASIFRGAFSPRAVTGGVVGSVIRTLRIGVSRGVFTNEAGMGTASIAHASAKVSHPCQQGLMGIVEVFLDTVVICTMTALVILCSGVSVPYGTDAGGALTVAAFSAVCGEWVAVFLAAALCCFAFATVLGWGLYGSECFRFLFGDSGRKWYVFAQSAMVIAGAVMGTGTVWSLAELMNGLMAIPNLIALVSLRRTVCSLTSEYDKLRGSFAAGGTYENFDQCKPLSALSHAQVPSLRAGGQETG